MSVSIGTGVSLGNLVTSAINPLTGVSTISSAYSTLKLPSGVTDLTLGMATAADIERISSGYTLYVDADRGSDATGTGSSSAPFETIQKALDTATPSFCIIVRGAGTYAENISIPSGKTSILIALEPKTKIHGSVTLNAGNASIKFKGGHIQGAISDASTGTLYFEDCNLSGSSYACTGSGYKQFTRCAGDEVSLTVGAAAVEVIDCTKFGAATVTYTTSALIVRNCGAIGPLTHGAGSLALYNVQSISASDGVSLTSTAGLGVPPAYLSVVNCSTQQTNGTWGAINKSGDCAYEYSAVQTGSADVVLTGPVRFSRQNIGDVSGLSAELEALAIADLSNVSNTDFAAKATEAGVGGGSGASGLPVGSWVTVDSRLPQPTAADGLLAQGATFNTANNPLLKVAFSTTSWYPTTKTETASQPYYSSICSDSNGYIYGIDRLNRRIMRSVDGGKTFSVFRNRPTTTPAISVLLGLTVSTINNTSDEYLVLWCSPDGSNSAYLCHTKVSVTTTTNWTNFVGMGGSSYVFQYGYMDTSIYGSNGSAIVSVSYAQYGLAEIFSYDGSTWDRKYCYPVSSADTAFIPTSSCVGRVTDDQFYTVLFINTAGTVRYFTNVHAGMSAGATGTALAQSIVTATNKIVFNKYDRKFYTCDHTTGKLAQIPMNASGTPQTPIDKGYVGGASQAGWNLVAITRDGAMWFAQNGTTNVRRLGKDATSFDVVNSGITTNFAMPIASSTTVSARNVLGCDVSNTDTKCSLYFHNFSDNESAQTAFTLDTMYFDYPDTASIPTRTQSGNDRHYMVAG